jgi:hypothetical protein
MLGPLKEEAKKRQEAGRNQYSESLPPVSVEASSEAVKQAAKLVGIGSTSVREAKLVAATAPHHPRFSRPSRRLRPFPVPAVLPERDHLCRVARSIGAQMILGPSLLNECTGPLTRVKPSNFTISSLVT